MATKYPSLFGAAREKSRGSVVKAIKRQPLKPPRAPRAKASYGRYAKGKPLLGADTVGESAQAPSARDVQLPQASFTGGAGSYDVGSDPAVARIGALSARIRAEAQASALAKRKQAALEYGDPTGVEGIDEQTAKAARENPFSILKGMERSYGLGVQDLEEGLNKGNLFYSGYRGQQLGEAANTYQQGRYDAGNRYRATIQDINDALASSLLNADMMDADAASGSDGGYYDPGSEWQEETDDGFGLAPRGPDYLFGDVDKLLSGQSRKPVRPARTVKVAGTKMPIQAARNQLNRAISEAKVRAKPAPAPKPKAKPKPKRKGGGV